MKTLAVLLFSLAACGGSPKSTPPTTTPPTTAPPVAETPVSDPPKEEAATFKPGPSGVPLPLDADDGAPAPGGGGAITVFKVPRGKLEVADELRATFKAEGWEIVDEETSPRGAIRIQIKKAETTMMARLTGDDAQTALIIQAK
jgi:hypothetical protein